MTTAIVLEPQSGFHELKLSSSLLDALSRIGYRKPTPIQSALIPRVLAGRDVIGQAQTGTGKTAAFLLPFLNRWTEPAAPGPKAVIMVPTRELVVQVCEEASRLAPNPECRIVPIYGGQRFGPQLAALRKGMDVIVGTPGRVLDHIARGTLNLQQVQYVVLDEADRMLDIGFRPDIERILRRCPQSRQTLLMSATLPTDVLRLCKRYMMRPLHINLSPKKLTVERIQQRFMTVDEDRKLDLLVKVLEREKPRQCIIFCQRKRNAHNLYLELKQHSKRVAVMHGDLSQPLRNKIMQAFRDAKVVTLVATDVVGRGIDVTNISHIVNYDLPEDPENYVHRIGRTGRMGANGVAIAFVTPEQGKLLTDIESFINKEIEEDRIEGFDAYVPRFGEAKPAEAPKQYVPVFGRAARKYSNRL